MNYFKITCILASSLFLSAERNANAQTITFNETGSLQTWTVPCTSSITITAYGAEGGIGPYGPPGLGAKIVGTFTVTPGQVLDLVVGQQGQGSSVGPYYCGSGGGGTFVWNSSNSTLPMIVAGGGGGNAYNDVAGGGSATVTPTSATNSAAGGSGGNGGSGGTCCTSGGGGGGWLSNGLNGSGGGGGFDPANGAAGGAAGSPGAAGGYGGGGGCVGNDGAGGGGGGYNGGGGGNYWNGTAWGAGGGGGSYNGGSSQTNVAATNTGNGSVTITWTLPAALVVSANVTTNETCNGGNTGSAASTVTGGATPYTYAWTGGGTNATVSGLTAGSYTVTVHDHCGNSASASVSITQPTAIVATITSTNVTCNGGDSATASSTVTGGTGAYTYSWTGGGTNAAITGLTAGTYNLNVQDANGCTGSATVTITQPTMLVVSDSTTANVWCHGDSTGSASSTVTGGTMPYMYLWTGGGTTDTAVGWMAGSYTLTVQDANGCTGSAMVTITQPSAIVIVEHTTPDNGSGNGTASVNVSGGVSPYTYAWTGGNTTDSISGKAKGTYCCTVKDANGCMDSVCITIVSTAGVNGITSNGGQITVYPNPNNGQFTIQSTLNAVSVVEVYNVLGEKVFSGNLNAGNNTINMSNQSNGIYLYRVMSESSLASGEIISEGKISVQK